MAAAVLLPLAVVPTWSGEPQLKRLGTDVVVHARAWAPKGGWPRRIGRLEPIGAVALTADDPAFGSFSGLALWRGQAILLGDGGTFVRLAIRGRTLTTLGSGSLPGGPGTGWAKADRDSESLAVDPATGRAWVGFERANAIFRYAPRFARTESWRAPRAMASWRTNSGAESLARLPDGRFVAIAEAGDWARREWPAVLFSGDPAAPGTRAMRLRYRPPRTVVPSDATALPDGDLLVVHRRWDGLLNFTVRIARVPAASIRPGGLMVATEIAHFPPHLLGENAEGIAVTREGKDTMVWLVTDNDGAFYRRTILAKFRLVPDQ
ncbi:hypothetical protein ASG29_14990 [Sphingomonas sp. Leaf412]|nr:hypothetical protein ASG29_14990 [Sphingomonas sp. Leaf412]